MQPATTGEHGWFEQMYAAHFHRVISFLRRRLPNGDTSIAEDLAADTFVTAWTKRDHITGDPTAWLLTTAHNHLRNYQRRGWYRRNREQELQGEDWIQPDPSEAADKRLDLRTAMAALSKSDRDILYLRYVDGRPANEIGGILGLKPDTARKRLSQATRRLRRQLDVTGDTPPQPQRALPSSPEPADGNGTLFESAIRYAQRYWIRRHLEEGLTNTRTTQHAVLSARLAAFLAAALTHDEAWVIVPAADRAETLLYDRSSNVLHLIQAQWIEAEQPFSEANIRRAAHRLNDCMTHTPRHCAPRLPIAPAPLHDAQLRITLAISAFPPRHADTDRLCALYTSLLPTLQATVRILDSASIYQHLPRTTTPATRLRITFLGRWMEPSNPPWIIMGVVSGDQIAHWQNMPLADTSRVDPSPSLELTLRHEPSRFWYHNNGLTIRADMMHPDPHQPATYTLEEPVLVHGTNIFASIISVAASDPSAAAMATVLIRVILPSDQKPTTPASRTTWPATHTTTNLPTTASRPWIPLNSARRERSA